MRPRYTPAAVTIAVLLSLAACSAGIDTKTAAAGTTAASPAPTTAPATTATTAPPAYRVYRNSPDSSGMGLADLLLTDTATKTAARAAIQDFVHKNTDSVAYLVHVVPNTIANGQFICEGQWRKDSAAVTTWGGKQGLTITCP